MTNEIKTNRKFKMLIGDDSFTDKRNAQDALLSMICSMGKLSGRKVVEGQFEGQNYSCPIFPLEGFDGAEIRVARSVEEMTQYSNESYDWIVTDFNYGPGNRTGGFDVLNKIKNSSAVKAVFTSEDNLSLLEQLAKSGADKIISPILMRSSEDKTTLLGKAITEHYQKMKGGYN